MRVTEFSIEFTSPAGPTRNGAASADLNADRIEAISRLGALLPPGEPALTTSTLLRRICAGMGAGLPAPKMKIRSSVADDIALAPAYSARLGLIATELLENAITHAHPAGVFGAVELSCQRDPSGVMLEVSDDGVGLPEGFDPHTHALLGLRVVRALADDLGASVRFNTGACGLQVQVYVPQQN